MTASSSGSANDGSHGRDARAPSLLTSVLYAACIVVAVALVVVANSPNAFVAPIGEPRVATAAEQRAILIALVKHEQSVPREPASLSNGARDRLVLENATLPICRRPRQGEQDCRALASPPLGDEPEASRNLTHALIDALPRFNIGQQPLDTLSMTGILWAERERLAGLLKTGYWTRFHQAYPQANGIVRVSRPVVSARGDQALLYVETTYDDWRRDGQMELFALRQGQWVFVRIVGTTEMWISCGVG